MKKIISLALGALLVFAALACCFSASAEEKSEPTFAADQSRILGCSEIFYTNNISGRYRLTNRNYFDNPAVLGEDNTPVNIAGIAGAADSKYVTVLGNFIVDSSAAIESGIFVFPATEGKAPHAFDAVDIYSGTELWNERLSNSYSDPLDVPSGRTFQLVASLSDVTGRLRYTADGNYAFFEFNFPAAVTDATCLILAFTAESRARIPAEKNGTHDVNMTEFAVFSQKIAVPDYKTENTDGKTDLVTGMEATFSCPKTENNGIKTKLLTDDIIAVNKNPAGEVEEKYFNKDYGTETDEPALSFAGVDGKFLYAFGFEGLNGAKVSEFQVVYSAQNDDKSGKAFNMAHADRQLALLVSSDYGATWRQVYSSALSEEANVAQSADVTGGKLTSVDDGDFSYYIVDIPLDKTYTNITNVAVASPLGRTQKNGWAARISEINVFGVTGTGVVTTSAQTTAAPVVTTAPEDSAALTTNAPTTTTPPSEEKGCGSVAAVGVFAVVAVLGAAVIRKKED